jgi:hypothetical protein
MKHRLPILVFLSLLAVVACGPASAPLATSLPSPVIPAPLEPTFTPEPTPTLTPQPTATPVSVDIRLVDLVDGGEIIGGVDSAGLPTALLSVIVSGIDVRDVVLDADGLQVARFHHDDIYATPFRANLSWSPWHGNGQYTLTVTARTADAYENYFTALASQTVSVQVVGIPDAVLSVRDRFIRLYQETWRLNVPSPAFARYIRPVAANINESRWVSVAYVGNYLYEIGLFDDGRVETSMSPLESIYGESLRCRPAGHYRMLVVVVDFGNTIVTREAALDAVQAAGERANQWHADYAAAHGLSEPIITLDVTGAYIEPPAPAPGEFLTAEQIESRTGLDVMDFDLVAQVDLDNDETLSQNTGGLGWALFGCQHSGPEDVNLYLTVSNRSITSGFTLTDALAGSLLDHEFSHDLGWMHWWPTGDGSAMAQNEWNLGHSCFPELLFGWVDVDGDGVIEIQDPTPYGMQL